jgi:hypothetical protein
VLKRRPVAKEDMASRQHRLGRLGIVETETEGARTAPTFSRWGWLDLACCEQGVKVREQEINRTWRAAQTITRAVRRWAQPRVKAAQKIAGAAGRRRQRKDVAASTMARILRRRAARRRDLAARLV